MADFEEMPDGPKIDYLSKASTSINKKFYLIFKTDNFFPPALEKDGFLSENPLYKCYVAVCDDVIIGYALYFFIYFTLDQKVLHLEDIYVMPDFRKKSVGSRLFNAVAKVIFSINNIFFKILMIIFPSENIRGQMFVFRFFSSQLESCAKFLQKQGFDRYD